MFQGRNIQAYRDVFTACPGSKYPVQPPLLQFILLVYFVSITPHASPASSRPYNDPDGLFLTIVSGNPADHFQRVALGVDDLQQINPQVLVVENTPDVDTLAA